MRTPKELYPDERIIYKPELSACPHCGGPLTMYNYLAWDKTIQTKESVLSVASRPGHCADDECIGHTIRLLSAEGQGIALPKSTYGYDVIAHIGWLRQEHRNTYSEIHSGLSKRVMISVSHVRYLYNQVYLPLLACCEREYEYRLAQTAKQYGGLIIALDGLAPEGGEPQLWFIRELMTGLTLRSGWLSKQNQDTFEIFLSPLSELDLPILAVLSDKQRGLVPAVAVVLPDVSHQFCQAHYLRNLAEPLAENDSAFNVSLRKAVRSEVGELIRTETPANTSQEGMLTVTGLLPDTSPVAASPQSSTVSVVTRESDTTADKIISDLLRHTRYLLTLKGRPPFYGTPHYLGTNRRFLRWKTVPDGFTAETQSSRRKT